MTAPCPSPFYLCEILQQLSALQLLSQGADITQCLACSIVPNFTTTAKLLPRLTTSCSLMVFILQSDLETYTAVFRGRMKVRCDSRCPSQGVFPGPSSPPGKGSSQAAHAPGPASFTRRGHPGDRARAKGDIPALGTAIAIPCCRSELSGSISSLTGKPFALHKSTDGSGFLFDVFELHSWVQRHRSPHWHRGTGLHPRADRVEAAAQEHLPSGWGLLLSPQHSFQPTALHIEYHEIIYSWCHLQATAKEKVYLRYHVDCYTRS